MADRKIEKRGLGRGLSALMADVNLNTNDQNPAEARRSDFMLPIEKLVPNPNQPRREFADDALADLAASILQKGIIQPLIVRPIASTDRFEIVAGERRWRAAQIAQLHDVPVIVRELDDTEVLEVAIIENIQRSDLNAIEEALGYRQLMDRFGHTQEKLAEAMSKSRSYIANLMRLLALPDEVQSLVRQGKLSVGHARALITSPNPGELARQIIDRGLSVRETERLASNGAAEKKTKGGQGPKRRVEKDADTKALELDLSASLNMAVQIDHEPHTECGRVSITYRSLEDLDLLCAALSVVRRDFAV